MSKIWNVRKIQSLHSLIVLSYRSLRASWVSSADWITYSCINSTIFFLTIGHSFFHKQRPAMIYFYSIIAGLDCYAFTKCFHRPLFTTILLFLHDVPVLLAFCSFFSYDKIPHRGASILHHNGNLYIIQDVMPV